MLGGGSGGWKETRRKGDSNRAERAPKTRGKKREVWEMSKEKGKRRKDNTNGGGKRKERPPVAKRGGGKKTIEEGGGGHRIKTKEWRCRGT